ncbi:phage integrase SAM-like domain-containing protein (plasmid) [Halococcus dombrowskii]|uniref:Phage integrase SAM-like domain-containing protein n=1 Tax=Halococcus dombrowskii TaxID=179637 RepID=A0AAV3SGN8_HALDO|nr:phage integrase SAM-like domain-containing protein [Halococcus dombrowskii]UOO96683.1 phage integrase SAM-like domain-containing protein [Halococcus dombrowskii]
MVRIDAVTEDFLTDKGKGQGGESGNYRQDAGRELDRFVGFLSSHEESPTTFDELESGHLREYARHLTRQGWTAGTVRTYYAYISAFCGWAVREGHLAENVAQRRNATEPIPDDGGHKSGDQQAWSAEDRRQLTTFVDEQASTAIDNVGEDREAAIKTCRDRALVYLLSYSGVRGAEILRDRSDKRRQGLRWDDVHLEDRYATVFAKKQRLDDRSLPNPVIHPLQMYQKVLDAPSESWPVFPSFHRPTLSQQVTDALDHRGYTNTEIEEMRTNHSLIELCVKYDIEPPSITTDAGRHVLKRLCEEAGIELDDGEEYLMPHGARRGAGEVLVRTSGHAAAARALDNSEEVVREHYSHIEAGDLADQMTDAFKEADSQQSTESGE